MAYGYFNATIFSSNKAFEVMLFKDSSIDEISCLYFTKFVYPFISFESVLTERDWINSLKRKAFALEYTDDIDNFIDAYLLLDERINDDEFYWEDLVKIEKGNEL